MHKEVFIFAAKRSPIGAFLGKFAEIPAHDLGSQVIKNIITATKISPDLIDEVVIGQVLTAGSGQNAARQAAVNAGIPVKTPAFLVNQVCGSGLKSVALAATSIMCGQNRLILAGGQENMSLCPYAMNLRKTTKMGDSEMIDLMIYDGLTDSFSGLHMGITAENIAELFKISREDQDKFALDSIQKAKKNQKRFKNEITSIKLPKDEIIDEDEITKFKFDIEKLSNMKPAFKKENGTVTAGNASSINDGAAFVLLGDQDIGMKNNLKPMAKIVSFAESGVQPDIMGMGPIEAIKKALQNAGWHKNEIDLFEINEAFASQSLAVISELHLNNKKINVNGGAIVLGHPIGASGTRCLVTLLYEMKKRQTKKGLVSLCVGGGMGIAMCVELC